MTLSHENKADSAENKKCRTIKVKTCGLGLGRYSHYWYTIDTEVNRYVLIPSLSCTNTSGSIIFRPSTYKQQ